MVHMDMMEMDMVDIMVEMNMMDMDMVDVDMVDIYQGSSRGWPENQNIETCTYILSEYFETPQYRK